MFYTVASMEFQGEFIVCQERSSDRFYELRDSMGDRLYLSEEVADCLVTLLNSCPRLDRAFTWEQFRGRPSSRVRIRPEEVHRLDERLYECEFESLTRGDRLPDVVVVDGVDFKIESQLIYRAGSGERLIVRRRS